MSLIRNILLNIIRHFPKIDSFFLILYRKYLGKKKGYPDWKKIVKTNNSFFKKQENNYENNQKVLIATSLGSHLPAMQMESTLAAALKCRQVNVHALLCDNILPACQMCEPRFFPDVSHFNNYGPSKKLCNFCFKNGRKVYDNLQVSLHSYSDNLTKKDITFAEKISSDLQHDQITNFSFKGINLGNHAKAGALRFYARATIDKEPYSEQVLRRYLKASILTYLSVYKLLKKIKFDVVVMHHGIYVPQGIICEVANSMSIRTVTWNPAYRKHCFIFSHNDTYHHTLMGEPTSVWNKINWTRKKDQIIINYLNSRWQGDNDWIKFVKKPSFDINEIKSKIGCDAKRPIIGCLTNVMWDAQLHYPANAFSNMLEWLIYTIKYFEKRTDLQLVIRVHPAELLGNVPSRQPVKAELKKYFSKMPKNIFIIPPESNISTYIVSELCDTVVIYGTKTGVELTSKGIPVIVAGEAWIRNKGITEDASNPNQYMKMLSDLPKNKRLSKKTQTLAKKYAYHFFFRRMIPVYVFQEKQGWPPYEFKGDIKHLKPGYDKGLDIICNGILKGTSFIYDSKN